MTIIQAIILGIIQGLTEFLPVSSSAHLVLTPYLLGWQLPEAQVFTFDVLVQVASLVAVIIYFWRDLWQIATAVIKGLLARTPFADPQARLGWYLVLATIPAVISALLLKKQVEAAFQSPAATAAFLLVTSLLLTLAETFGRRSRPLKTMNWLDALWIGIAQAVSILPGISRSGSTISTGMLRHLDRPSAARFAFLMSVPIMLGAGIVQTNDLVSTPGLSSFIPVLLVGCLASGVVSYFAIRWMINFVSRHSLRMFSVYTAALGLLTLVVYFVAR